MYLGMHPDVPMVALRCTPLNAKTPLKNAKIKKKK